MATQTYSFRIQAEGLNAFRSEFEAAAKGNEQLAGAWQKLIASSPQLVSAMTAAERSVDQTVAATTRYQQAAEAAGRGVGNLGQVVGQAGFQLQDFAVQVQGGTSALTALSQQGSQFLGLFGTGGAIAGAVLAVGALATQFLLVGNAAEDAKREAESYAGSVRTLNDLLETSWQRTARLRREQQQSIIASQRSLAEAETLRGERIGTDILRLERQIAPLEAQRAGLTPANQRLFDDQLGSTLDDLRQRLASLRSESERTAASVQESMRIIREAERVNADPVNYESGAGTVFPFETVQEAIFRQGARANRIVENDAQRLQESFDKFWDNAELRAEQRTDREAEQRDRALERSRLRDETRVNQQIDRTSERWGASLADAVVSGLALGSARGEPFLARLGTTLEAVLLSAVSQALGSLVFTPAIRSVLGGGGGAGGLSLGSLFGGGAAGTGSGGGLLSGVDPSTLFSLGRTGFNAFQGGLTNAVDLGSIGFLQGTSIGGVLNTPLFGAAGQLAATNSAIGGLGAGVYGPATPAAVSAAGGSATGLTTLGTALGGVGLGFGAGSLVGSLVSNARGTVGPGSTIGAGGGAAAGAAIGSIIPGIGTVIGALIGGVLGGAGGGLIGPTKKGLESRSGGAVYFLPNDAGLLEITGAAGKRFNEGEAVASVQGQLDQINAAIQPRGLYFTDQGFDQYRVGQVGFGQAAARAGAPSQLNLSGLTGLLRSDDPAVNTAITTTAGRGGDLDAVLSAADWVRNIYQPLIATKQEVSAFETEMNQLLDTFGAAAARARDLGLSEEELNRKRDEAVAELESRRQAQLRGFDQNLQVRNYRLGGNGEAADLLIFDSAAASERDQASALFASLGLEGAQEALTRLAELERTQAEERLAIQRDYAEQALAIQRQQEEEQLRAAEAAAEAQRQQRETVDSLLRDITIGDLGGLSPAARYAAGAQALGTARGALFDSDGATQEDVAGYVSIARQFLPVAKDFLGISEGYGSLLNDVSGTLRQAVPGADGANLAALIEAQVSGADRLEIAVLEAGEAQVDVLNAVLSQLRTLTAQNEALLRRVNT